MKFLNIIALLILSSAAVAQDNTGPATETTTEKLDSFKDWQAQKVSGHLAWNKEACTATTQTDSARLEVYAEQITETGYAEPTVQVLVSDIEEQVYSATLETNRSKEISLTLASQAAEQGMQVVMARLKDRATFVEALKADNNVTVKFKNVKNRTIKRIRFSLRGSNDTISAQFESCNLNFNQKL